ncbi:hypothetical protein Q7C36_019723 [Tachysurus vachellii]|uniref:Uncharacterized protein n=1 Tax=Tachysurus vachellii TaxID=175792 RepID=A0AA88LSE0_TACVA|nr:hypothetical protein Q7C36_019723 [Tachysurus vachellii]
MCNPSAAVLLITGRGSVTAPLLISSRPPSTPQCCRDNLPSKRINIDGHLGLGYFQTLELLASFKLNITFGSSASSFWSGSKQDSPP